MKTIQGIAWRKDEDGYLDLRPIQEPISSITQFNPDQWFAWARLTHKIAMESLRNMGLLPSMEINCYMKGPASDVRLYCRNY